MGASALPLTVLTLFWIVVGCVLPFVIPKGPNRGLLQVILILTAGCCWLFWLCCYLAQMNPLIGPKLSNRTLILMAKAWSYALRWRFSVYFTVLIPYSLCYLHDQLFNPVGTGIDL